MLYTRLMAPPMFGLHRDIDQMLEEVIGQNGAARAAWIPATDVRETEQAITFEMELPGVSPEQVEITAEKRVLTIKGQKGAKDAVQDDKERRHIMERVSGSFVRSFALPDQSDESGIEATFEAGVLTVRVPKTPLPQPKRIEIKAK
jgi:HSP20 family protein